ncbi:lipoprotein [Streptomyces syringium]|uniref:lipoprotein n=1 Tax=Streptomyces syringium TaxID=76729 RepID=UPI00341A7931
MRKLTWAAATAVLSVGMLTGCSSADEKSGDTAKASAGATKQAEKKDTGKAAGKTPGKKDDARIGTAGTACELPASFEVAKGWKPAASSADDAKMLAKLNGRTSVTAACVVDAKPAGLLGNMRVWTAARSDKSPRQVLDAFMAEEKRVSDQEFSETKVGGLPAAEVTYKESSPLLDEPSPQRALAVTTPKGTMVLHLTAFDGGEYKDMLPAFELAKKTMLPAA